MTVLALDVGAWNGTAAVTLRYATVSFATAPNDTPADTQYLGRIVDAGMQQRSLFSGGGILGKPSTNIGSISLGNADSRLDPLISYGFDGRSWVLRELSDVKQPVATATIIASGVLAGIDTSNAWTEIRLRLRDQLAALALPLLTERYAGTSTAGGTGIEGDADLAGQLKPYVFGFAQFVAPKLANKYDLVYQVSVGAVATIVVYDGAVALTNAGDKANLSALLAWTAVPGNYVTCKARGLFRLGGSPAFTVTADATEGAALALRSAARVAGRMLDLFETNNSTSLDRDDDSFDDAHAAKPAEVGIYIDADTNASDLIGQILISSSQALIPTSEGAFEVITAQAPSAGSAVATFTERDAIGSGSLTLAAGPSQEGDGVPAWSIIVNYARVWQTLDSGQMAGSVDAGRQAYLALSSRPTTPARDSAVRTAHPNAAEITVDTLLTTQADAAAQAAEWLALYSVRRDYATLTVPKDRGRIELGNDVLVDINRFGWDGGKAFKIVSRKDDYTKETIDLGLYG